LIKQIDSTDGQIVAAVKKAKDLKTEVGKQKEKSNSLLAKYKEKK